MRHPDWHDPLATLDVVDRVLAAVGVEEGHGRLSDALQGLAPHRALAVLNGQCARSPMIVLGEPDVADHVTSADLAHLAATVPVGTPWRGRAQVAGAERPVAVVASADAGALLVLVLTDAADPSEEELALAARLWTLHLHLASLTIDVARPDDLTASRVAAAERARVLGELTDAHAATLSGLLGTLRARDLDDRAARRAATDLAASALVELRSAAVREREQVEEPAAAAFARLRDQLEPLTRYSTARLELVAPDDDRAIPGPVAQAARAIVRGAVLTLLEQEDVGRIRVGWELDAELRVTVRDDGPGGLDEQALAVHSLEERARALHGSVELESPAGWGTRLLARLPLGLESDAARPAGSPLAALNPREVDVLALLARGQRNRQIAAELQISENTVKFHVANVLSKLEVSSRGEAAALARDSGLGAAPLAVVS